MARFQWLITLFTFSISYSCQNWCFGKKEFAFWEHKKHQNIAINEIIFHAHEIMSYKSALLAVELTLIRQTTHTELNSK